MVFEMKFVENNILCECAIHLLHVMHSQLNLQWFWDYIVFFVDLHVRCQQQTNKSTLFAAKLRFAFFRSCMSFSQHVDGQDECFEIGEEVFGSGNGW